VLYASITAPPAHQMPRRRAQAQNHNCQYPYPYHGLSQIGPSLWQIWHRSWHQFEVALIGDLMYIVKIGVIWW